MRHVVVSILALVLLGSSASALPLFAPTADVTHSVASARAQSDALRADFAALPQDVASTIDAGLRIGGFAPATIHETRSASLEAALLNLYDVLDVAVDANEVSRQSAALAPSDADAIRELVDAVADAQIASARILSPEDRAALADDLPTQMKLMTLRGDTRLTDVLARADMGFAAAAALRVSHAMAALPELLPVEGCGRAIDLPFIQIGAPCDDVYSADDIILIDYGGNDQYLNNAGSGIAGVGAGFAIDQGAGNDVYRAQASAQGSATAGVGFLVDEGGSDLYNLSQFGQGFATAGVALLYDQGDGNDVYESNAADSIGTKGGSLAGVGILRDDGGVDLYQQDGVDGFIYGAAGGTGILLDYGSEDGDAYVAHDQHILLLGEDLGYFAGPIMVSAEAGGIAILYEEGGDTLYDCGDHVRQGCEGAAGVGAFALLLDVEGDDVYMLGLSVTPLQLNLIPGFASGQGGAYGEASAPPGAAIGMLRDLVGDDAYIADKYAQGYSTGGLGLLFDESGADSYTMNEAPLVGSRADGQTWADGLALGVGIDQA